MPDSKTMLKVKSMRKSELEEITAQSIETLQKVITILKNTGHDHLLTDLITSKDLSQAQAKLVDIKDVSTILNEDTCSTLERIGVGDWEIKSPLIDKVISSESAFDAVISYVRELEELAMDNIYSKDIRLAMNTALNRAKSNMDDTNSGRELFEKGGIRVWIEVRISNNVNRWIIDSDEKGSTLIHRTDEEAIIRFITGLITDNYRKSKKKED